jgi:hypothetical protein
MDILHIEKKGPLMNIEQFHIYSLWKENLQINDIYTDIHNPIFNVITDHYKQHKNPTTTPHPHTLNTRQQHNSDSPAVTTYPFSKNIPSHNSLVNFHVYISA